MINKNIKQHKLTILKNIIIDNFIQCQEESLFNCMTDLENIEYANLADGNISSNNYDPEFERLINEDSELLILDVGAGYRPKEFKNVINLEIARFPTTDVLSVAEHLPFKDCVFDVVHSNAVLEHVKNPFDCANEMMRVLKPGGRIWAFVPFLQPYHGYPNHYYNMTHNGIENLFSKECNIIEKKVPHYYHPIYALEWFIRQYTWRLTDQEKKEFLDLRLGEISEICKSPDRSFIKNLHQESIFELCSGSLLIAEKFNY